MLLTFPFLYYPSRYTIRSIMGDFDGNIAVLEIKTETGNDSSVSYEFYQCPFVSTALVATYFIALICWILVVSIWVSYPVIYPPLSAAASKIKCFALAHSLETLLALCITCGSLLSFRKYVKLSSRFWSFFFLSLL